MKLLRDNPCLTEFFTAVLALPEPEPEPNVLSFTLRLAGIVAAVEDSFMHLQVSYVPTSAFSCTEDSWKCRFCL